MVAMGAISSIYVGHSCPSNGCCVPPASERAKRALRLLSATTERVLFVAHISAFSLRVCALRSSVSCFILLPVYYIVGTVSRVDKRSFFSPFFSFSFLVFQRHFE